jgi:hypothetical protein
LGIANVRMKLPRSSPRWPGQARPWPATLRHGGGTAGKIAAIAWHIPPIARGRQHERSGMSINGYFSGIPCKPPEYSLLGFKTSLFGFKNFPVRVREFRRRFRASP